MKLAVPVHHQRRCVGAVRENIKVLHITSHVLHCDPKSRQTGFKLFKKIEMDYCYRKELGIVEPQMTSAFLQMTQRVGHQVGLFKFVIQQGT